MDQRNIAFGVDDLAYEPSSNSVSVPIELPEEARRRPDSLADYESDFWKIAGNMMECGFGDIYCEAVDWEE